MKKSLLLVVGILILLFGFLFLKTKSKKAIVAKRKKVVQVLQDVPGGVEFGLRLI